VGGGATDRRDALLVATVDEDGAPHLMPVWAVWHDGCLWFSAGGRSRKVRNLRAEPRCAVHADGDDPLVVHGVVEFVSDPGPAALAAYRRKYGQTPPDPSANPIARLRPLWAFGLVERAFSSSPTRWRF
jgi:hypothetical protein